MPLTYDKAKETYTAQRSGHAAQRMTDTESGVVEQELVYFQEMEGPKQ